MTDSDATRTLEQAFEALRAGDHTRAQELSQQILATTPDNPHGHHLTGLTELQRGDAQGAAHHLERAVRGDPNHPDFRLNYGVALEQLGRAEDAAGQYRAALSLGAGNSPFAAKAAANLGFMLRRMGDYPGAIEAFEQALSNDPDHVGAQLGFVHILGNLRSPEPSPELEDALVRGVHLRHANLANLSEPIAHQLGLKYDFAALRDAVPLDTLAHDPLFIAYLEHCLNTDPEMEFFLTDLRRSLILTPIGDITDDALSVATLLARQCFLNEYVWQAGDDEKDRVADLKQHLEDALQQNPGTLRAAATLFALYAPLSNLEERDALATLTSEALGAELDELVSLTLRNFLEERDILDKLEMLHPISDETSRAVGAMYEESPYPRWLHAQAQQPTTIPAFLRGLFPHCTPPSVGAAPNILIAGSGTGQQVVLVARTHPDATITAIDLSKASLSYAVRMTRALGITNVRFAQADILKLTDLNQTFDMIQSVGVLHHLKEPRAGWRVLSRLLKAGGVFKVGLYSTRGRMGIEACRRTIADEGIGSTPADIARFRRRILSASPDGKDASLREVTLVRDFFTTSMCRDLLFHVHELGTTPKGLADDIAACGLEFIGFEGFEDVGINEAYREAFPDDPALTNLDNWEAFEAEHGPLTDLYQLWCFKPPA
ncbi:MAG: methyltransferase domain-containing protein [Alphaproteobacteria bacterium]|jgi:SAM-dependent methyltransferase|nr:methyltransferase domain-containing protein [Alphaproteobacteria bacterium]MBT7942390.1 methyltransferase domain-containing protein [Alphaproteobacteria bacterium]